MANPFNGMFGLMNSCRHCGNTSCHGECQVQAKLNASSLQVYQDALSLQMQAMMPPVPVVRAPLPQDEIICATGGIVGWRSWRVPCFGDDLRSFNGELWPVRKALRATCRNGAPECCKGEYCTCGLYAWKHRISLIENQSVANSLFGEVWLWGKIIEHEKGYRAEYSYPKSFVNSGPDARRLARIYGVKLIEG
jgi:hypothetical protein